MTARRAAFLIEVDLDPIPGFGHTRQSWRDWLAALLDRSAGHYQPTVADAVPLVVELMDLRAERAYLWDRLAEAYELLAAPPQPEPVYASEAFERAIAHIDARAKAAGIDLQPEPDSLGPWTICNCAESCADDPQPEPKP